MRKSRQILLTILITGALLALAWTAGSVRNVTKMTAAVKVNCDINAGTRITADQLTVIQLPADSLADCYFADPAEAIGLWTSVELHSGELVSSRQLTVRATGLQYSDPGPGRRLLTIKLEPSDANGFWLAAGSQIDIYLIPRNRETLADIQTLENVRVMAVLESGTGEPIASNITKPASGDKLICLDLNSDQARLLSSAPGVFDIRLAVINEISQSEVG